MYSIEALLSRVAREKWIPNINAAVDLDNSVSLKYKLPIGAYGIDSASGKFSLRYSESPDSFIPFGITVNETADESEIVYFSGNSVRTRK